MKWLIVLGIGLTIGGVILAFSSLKNNATVTGDAAPGVAMLAPPRGSEAALESERVRKRSDHFFYWGILLTLVGGAIEVIGTVLTKQEKRVKARRQTRKKKEMIT
jgi:hypothetical protein